ncbi:MAG: hypothetical protein LBS42_04360 [Tannerella sp.]|jgi:hypothetical protein|nr:hypothetical protein [Tannerella sp.]
MKRIIAISLLIVTLFASGHATWVFHYCSGSLRNVGLAGYTEVHACCCRMASHEASGNQPAVGNTPCCANRFLSLITDDYPVARYETSFETAHDFQPAPYVGYDMFRPCENTLFQPQQQAFPPGGLARHGAALRLLICIYLI